MAPRGATITEKDAASAAYRKLFAVRLSKQDIRDDIAEIKHQLMELQRQQSQSSDSRDSRGSARGNWGGR